MPTETKEAQMSQSEYKAAEDLNKKLKERVKELEAEQEALKKDIALMKEVKALKAENEALKRNLALMKALQAARDGMSRQN
jgi:regulator of replication initiation timing